MTFRLSQRSRNEMMGVHPDLKAVFEKAITTTPNDFGIHSGLRSAREQRALYNRGASKLDGYSRRSKHQVQTDGYGHAIDAVPWVAGAGWRWEWPLIYPIAGAVFEAAQELGVKLRWGGVWDQTMDQYMSMTDARPLAEQARAAVHAYTVRHPGPDFIDGPHYELA